MRSRPSAQTAAAVALLALVGILALLTQRNDAAKYDTFASTDFASGGVRAWAALLEREGVRTGRFVRRPVELDGSTDTLVTIAPLPFLARVSGRTAADVAALADWVRRGGRLVYVGRAAGLAKVEDDRLQLPQWLAGIGRRGTFSGDWVRLAGLPRGFGTNRMLLWPSAHGTSELHDDLGDVIVRYPLGRGEVIAVTDPVPFTNEGIARGANARFAYLLGRPRRAGGVVAFDDGVHGALRDRPWYRALPPAVLVALAFAALAAALALAGAALPSGTPFALTPKREPTSAEFIAALAALYERVRARDDARDIIAQDTLAAVARRVGASERASPLEIAAAARLRGDGESLERYVETLHAPLHSDAELVTSVRLAHTLRKEFRYGGNGDGRRAAFAGRSQTRRRR